MSLFLLALMSLLIDGEVNVEGICSQADLAIFRLVTYNKKKLRNPSSRCLNRHHYNKEREISVTIYVGLKLYSAVRCRTIIDYLFSLRICISCDRILSITKTIYEILRKSYDRRGLYPDN